MENLQRETLQSLLRITAKTPPQHQQEEIEMAVKTRLGLYNQEDDPEGAKVYKELLPLVQRHSRKELEQLARNR